LPNRAGGEDLWKKPKTAFEDTSAAAENVMICRVDSHQKPHPEAAKKLVCCPKNLELAVIPAVGYSVETPPLPSKKVLSTVL